ncbi:helix-turn-helix domain-containing protein [Streptomyces sp. NBC_01433]|uniref:ArsR/SmtB family transcription factor n=1 Tax=Streptomyces sp. NBC_01433 TaxID=2903864 RepID=UPI00225B2721|nr:helix-turn-helix domain-containing protein [Streptomyces sp. NBC_01433]MCX4673824.1 helix-turn-helix domain-containing protein [Streptomyces sp. NBC_01433]
MAEKPGGTETTELAALKALAQPRRQRIFQHLTLHGPATSASLARALGLNTGATSYHLRELARYGFVVETEPARTEREDTGPRDAEASGSGAEAPGARRRRWWRAIPGDRRFPFRSRQNPETRLVMDELNHHAYAEDLALFERLQRDAPLPARESGQPTAPGQAEGAGEPDEGEWADAFAYSRGSLRLTLPELREFFEEYIALMNRYKRPEDDVPPASRTVHTRLLAFPAPASTIDRTETDAR